MQRSHHPVPTAAQLQRGVAYDFAMRTGMYVRIAASLL